MKTGAPADVPATTAVRALRDHGIPFTPCFYPYEEHGGTRHASASLGVAEHAVVKTLVMETERREPFLVLMHGDCEVSTKELARTLGVKRVLPCDPPAAHRHTGYVVGGISPLGTRSPLPVMMEESILSLSRIYLNGGKRGFLVAVDPHDLLPVLPVTMVHIAIPHPPAGPSGAAVNR